jgi:opacity protein-like surface antigen
MRRRLLCVPFAALAIAQAASADDSGWYLGAGVGLADTADRSQLCCAGFPLLTGRTHDNKTSWGVAAGYRFNQSLAIELGYVDLGELTSEVADATAATDARAAVGFSAEGVTLAMIGTLPFGKWEPYLKAGVFYSSTVLEYSGSLSGVPFGARITNDDEDAIYGIGVGYALSEHIRIHLDTTYFMEVGEPEKGRAEYLNTSIGATWRF